MNRDRLNRIGLREPDWSGEMENVTQFTTHPTNDHFAYVVRDAETGGQTLHICNWGIRAWYHGAQIEELNWAGGARGDDKSISLGFMDSKETIAPDGKRRVDSAVYTWRPAQSPDEKFTRLSTPQ